MIRLAAACCSVLLVLGGCTSVAEDRASEGLALARAGDLEGARRAFESALATDGHCLKALYNLGLLDQVEGRPRDALSVFERFVALRPGDAPGQFEVARAHAILGEKDAAIAALRRAVELGFGDHAALTGPEFAPLQGELGYVMLEVTVAQRSGVPSQRVAPGAGASASTGARPIRPPRSQDPACTGGATVLEPRLPGE
jgi:tetratricopeptide (TPR) repeat protein